VKPYAECIVLCILWFVPLPVRPRAQILRWINRFSRWTFLDMLFVITLAACLDIYVVNSSVHLVLEARAAMYTFVILSLALTPIGEWMSYRASVLANPAVTAVTAGANVNNQEESALVDPANLGCCGRPLPTVLDTILTREVSSRRFSPLLCLVAPANLGLTIATIVVSPAVGWTLNDYTGLTSVDRQSWSNSFADLGVRVASPASTSPAGGTFIAIVYYMMVVIIPIATATAMTVVAFSPPNTRVYLLALRFAQVFNPFTSLDVALIGLLSVATEYKNMVHELQKQIVPASLQDMLSERNLTAINASGEAGVGCYLAIGAIILTYIAQLLTAVQAAVLEANLKSAGAKLQTTMVTSNVINSATAASA